MAVEKQTDVGDKLLSSHFDPMELNQMFLAIHSPDIKSTPCPPMIEDYPTSLDSLVLRTLMEDVQARAQAKLRACPYREVQKTTCFFHKGVLLLQGTVSSYYLKQIAQTVLMHVEGVRHIVNTIRVHSTVEVPTGHQP